MNCRKSETNRARGGLAIFVKKDIVTGIKLVDKSISDLMWLKRDKQKFGLEKNLFIFYHHLPS
jgi:hypothetical protein